MVVIGVFTLLLTFEHLNAQPVIDAPWGVVEGTTNVTEDWTPYHAFFGIPFAVPPIGSRRFMRPKPHPGFKITFKANKYGPACVQTLTRTVGHGATGDEDCLTLNVFTPASITETTNIPVIVWIYGGGFTGGNAFAYDPSSIVAHGQVIMVTIQYRLGRFYFVPTIDGIFVKDDPLLLMSSPGYLKQVGLQNLDCMVSVVSNEGGLFKRLAKAADYLLHSSLPSSVQNKTFYRNTFIPEVLQVYFGGSFFDMTEAVAKVYAPSQSHTVTLQAVMNTLGRAHSKLSSNLKTGKKTYMYVFDHVPSFLTGHGKGMDHGEDLYYTFGLSKAILGTFAKVFPISSTDPDELERKLSHTLMGLLTDFARYGDPNNAVQFGLNQTWPQFSEPGEHYLLLNTTMSVRSKPYKDRVTLWTQTLPRLLQAAQNQQHTTKDPQPNIIG